MVRPYPPLPPRVGLRLGERTLPAIPVLLRGDEASLVVPRELSDSRDVSLVLDWEDGAVTELSVRVRSVDAEGRIAHLDVHNVGGDWEPFCSYLGELGTYDS